MFASEAAEPSLIPAAEAVATWTAAMRSHANVATESAYETSGQPWTRMLAIIADSGHTFRIDGHNLIGSTAIDSMIAVDDRAWVSKPHDSGEPDDAFDWVEVPHGPKAERERYRWVFDIAGPFPSFSDPWRILPRLLTVPAYSVQTADARRMWCSAPYFGLPLFDPFGSERNPIFTITVECDQYDLPQLIDMRLADRENPTSYQAWTVTMTNWGAPVSISPPPPDRVQTT